MGNGVTQGAAPVVWEGRPVQPNTPEANRALRELLAARPSCDSPTCGGKAVGAVLEHLASGWSA
jgi:hypothetical protein